MTLANPAESLEGLSEAINELQHGILQLVFEPDAKKELRLFSLREAARWMGLSIPRLRAICTETGIVPESQRGLGPKGGLLLTAEQIHAVRRHLAKASPRSRRYRPSRSGSERAQVIASMIFKGGTGKTVLAVHFAQYLSLRGYRVLLVDLDPQASATTLFGINPAAEVRDDETFYGAVCGERKMSEIVRKTYWPNLDLVPANLALAMTDFEIAGRARTSRRPIHAYLTEALDEVRDRYDVIVLDCRPDLGMTTLNALLAATGVFVPVTMSQIDIASMGEFFRFSSVLLQQLPELGLPRDYLEFDFIKLVINRFDPGHAAQLQCHHWLQARMPEWVVRTPMLQTAALGHATAQWQTLYEYEPDEGRRRAYNRALQALDGVCYELESVVWQAWGRTGSPIGLQMEVPSE
jgi:chromosome partitioning protein